MQKWWPILPKKERLRGGLVRPLWGHPQWIRWELLRDLCWLLLLRATPLWLLSPTLRQKSLPRPLGPYHLARGRSPLSRSRKGHVRGLRLSPQGRGLRKFLERRTPPIPTRWWSRLVRLRGRSLRASLNSPGPVTNSCCRSSGGTGRG